MYVTVVVIKNKSVHLIKKIIYSVFRKPKLCLINFEFQFHDFLRNARFHRDETSTCTYSVYMYM